MNARRTLLKAAAALPWRDRWRCTAWLWHTGRGHRLQALLNTSLGVASVLTALLFVWATKLTVDIATHADHRLTLTQALALLSGLALVEILLGVAILVKLWLFFYYGKIAKKINSAAIRAASFDSISDTIATTLVLVSALISRYAHIAIDGWAGIIVAAFILFTGFKAAKETIELLLGSTPDPEFVKKIYEFVKNYPQVIGIHDVMVHDYGPGRLIVSFHAEVPSDSNFCYAHDVVDCIERDMHDQFGCIVTIHIDPIDVNDERVNEMRKLAEDTAKEVDESFTIHDFRMTYGGKHYNMIFDLSIPTDSKYDDEEAAKLVAERIKEKNPDCFAVIKAEHPFV